MDYQLMHLDENAIVEPFEYILGVHLLLAESPYTQCIILSRMVCHLPLILEKNLNFHFSRKLRKGVIH